MLMEDIKSEEDSGEAYAPQAMRAALTLALIRLLRDGTNYLPAVTTGHVQRALDYIHRHYADASLRLTTVADACGLSSCHFSDTFHRVVGYGFSEYLSDYRLNQACALLKESDAPVTEIAYEVGFASLSHFFRVFRKTYRYTPRQYRGRMRTDAAEVLKRSATDDTPKER
jgi:AraC-like DNA-binding protein